MYAPTRLTVSGHLQHASSSRRTSYPSTCETPSSASTTRRGFRNLIGALPSHRLRRRRHPHSRHARLRNHNSGTDNNDVGEEVSTPTTTTAPAISGYVHKEISITDGTGMSHTLRSENSFTLRSEKIPYHSHSDPRIHSHSDPRTLRRYLQHAPRYPLHDPRRSTAAGANVPRSRYTLDCTTSSSRRVPGGSVIGLRMIS